MVLGARDPSVPAGKIIVKKAGVALSPKLNDSLFAKKQAKLASNAR
jgi:hypothetical protein